jgi:hypothetical protein
MKKLLDREKDEIYQHLISTENPTSTALVSAGLADFIAHSEAALRSKPPGEIAKLKIERDL